MNNLLPPSPTPPGDKYTTPSGWAVIRNEYAPLYPGSISEIHKPVWFVVDPNGERVAVHKNRSKAISDALSR